MRYYNKTVYPKEIAENDPEFGVWVKKRIAHNLADAVLDNMTFDKSDDCINYPEFQDKNGWVTKFIGSIDISIPTKLMPMGSVYVCENCFSNHQHIPRSYSFYSSVPKYCECCGAHFTNIFQDSELNDGQYFIKNEGCR